MGKRTEELPPLTGLPHLVRELRYQEAARQGLGLLLMALFALLARPLPGWFALGAACVVAGSAVRLYASGYIAKNQELATDGPYSLVRHPLYLGNLLLLVGFTAASGRWWAVPVAVGFWWFYYPAAIDWEDRKLRRMFGQPCVEWQGVTPAVLPSSWRPRPGGSWSLRTSLSRNVEPLVLAYSLFWLGWVYRQL